MAGTLQIQTVSDLPTPYGTQRVNLTITIPGTVDFAGINGLANGDNVFVAPASSTVCILVPPTGNVIITKIKGIVGDTGAVIAPNNPSVIAITAGETFIINAAAAIAGYQVMFL